MGEPVKIVHIAEELIRLHGLEPNRDIDIQFTGLRPGELNRDRAPISPEEIGALSLFNSNSPRDAVHVRAVRQRAGEIGGHDPKFLRI